MKPFFLYGLAILLMKGFSLISIPLVAHYLPPADFGDLDIATSLVEFTGIIAALGLADTLYRFAPKEGRAAAAGIAGTALISALLLLFAGQVLAPMLHAALGLAMPVWGLRAGLAAAAIGGLIELPLAWLRFCERPKTFLGFIAARSVAQILFVWLFLATGKGAAGMFLATLFVHGVTAAGLTLFIARETGIHFRKLAFRRLAAYGLPLMVSALSMFALGSLDRWFLAGAAAKADIAHYAIAMKFALAISLVIQPLALWWNPKRLAVLSTPGGKAANARVWRMGVVILAIGGAGICLAMPLFFTLALPEAYGPALHYLPALAGLVVINEIAALSNAGAYLGRSSLPVLAVNAAAALVAVSGYALLVPAHGIAGAILATYAAQIVRLAAFCWQSRESAPVPLLSPGAALTLLSAAAPVALLQGNPPMQLAALGLAPAATAFVAWATGMLRLNRAERHAFPF